MGEASTALHFTLSLPPSFTVGLLASPLNLSGTRYLTIRRQPSKGYPQGTREVRKVAPGTSGKSHSASDLNLVQSRPK